MRQTTVVRLIALAVLLVLGHTLPGSASLVPLGADGLGRNLIYDTDQDLTWYDFTQPADWHEAMSWADLLEVHFSGATLDDWRLPTAIRTCAGEECESESELGQLYYTLGNEYHELPGEGDPPPSWGLSTGPFLNLRQTFYWSFQEYFPGGGDPPNAWDFSFLYGRAWSDDVTDQFHAMAVRDGRAGSPVPEPSVLLLVLSGLAGLGIRARRNRHP